MSVFQGRCIEFSQSSFYSLVRVEKNICLIIFSAAVDDIYYNFFEYPKQCERVRRVVSCYKNGK